MRLAETKTPRATLAADQLAEIALRLGPCIRQGDMGGYARASLAMLRLLDEFPEHWLAELEASRIACVKARSIARAAKARLEVVRKGFLDRADEVQRRLREAGCGELARAVQGEPLFGLSAEQLIEAGYGDMVDELPVPMAHLLALADSIPKIEADIQRNAERSMQVESALRSEIRSRGLVMPDLPGEEIGFIERREGASAYDQN